MPASWAKAFSPTTALFGCTWTPVMWERSREALKISSVRPRVDAEEVLARPERHHDLLAVRPRVTDRVDRCPEHLGAGLPQLVLQVDVGGRDERVDARLTCVLHRFPAAVDVGQADAREAADRRRVVQGAHLAGHRAGGLEVLVRRDREAGLDDVDLEPGQLPGHLELLHRVHGEAGRLLAVPQRRVEDDDAIHTASYGDSLVASSAGAESERPTSRRRTGPETA